jgi:O-antigen/teichoic acid export membrane protein
MNSVHRSIGFSAISKYGSTAFQLLCIAVLARLLTPAEFGIYTTVYAFITIANATSREFGGANYLIQKPALEIDDIKTAFTISFVMAARCSRSRTRSRRSIPRRH